MIRWPYNRSIFECRTHIIHKGFSKCESVTSSLDIKHLCVKHARACALAALVLTCVTKLTSEHRPTCICAGETNSALHRTHEILRREESFHDEGVTKLIHVSVVYRLFGDQMVALRRLPRWRSGTRVVPASTVPVRIHKHLVALIRIAPSGLVIKSITVWPLLGWALFIRLFNLCSFNDRAMMLTDFFR